ncbi:hypothetical protein ACTXT7_005652 [Hymenolepis weldensis]
MLLVLAPQFWWINYTRLMQRISNQYSTGAFIHKPQFRVTTNMQAPGPQVRTNPPGYGERFQNSQDSLFKISPYDFMQTRGKGLHESEVYTVLFRHTTCYELMPESAKLVTLDSILPVGKAFRALCENGIRAAPVWDSETQTFSGVLTINDFLEMLTYCWRKLIGNNTSAPSGNPNPSALESSEKISIEELESMPIKKWKVSPFKQELSSEINLE